MALHYKTKGFVFRKNNRLDTDRTFTIFTDQFGRMDIFAKAIRKINSKLKGGIDIFFLSEIEFIQGKNRKTLTDATAIKRFSYIPKDIKKMKIAHSISVMMDKFLRGQERDQRILELAIDVFEKINDDQYFERLEKIIPFYFFWNFMDALGHKPEVNKCSVCGLNLEIENVYFSCKEGGVICKACSINKEGIKNINANVVKMLRVLFQKDWEFLKRVKIDNLSQKMLKEATEDYYKYLSYGYCPDKNN